MVATLGELGAYRDCVAGETVPYFPAAGNGRQGFARIANRNDEDGHVFIRRTTGVLAHRPGRWPRAALILVSMAGLCGAYLWLSVLPRL